MTDDELMDHFTRRGPGDYVVKKRFNMQSPGGKMSLGEGSTVKRGVLMFGVDMAEKLDQVFDAKSR